MQQEELTAALARLSAVLGPREGSPEPLPGGFTRRAFRVRLGGMDYAVHMPGEEAAALGTDPHSEQEAGLRAAELGIAPPVVATLDKPLCFVTAYVSARPLTGDELREPDILRQVAAAVRAFHESGVALPRSLDPVELIERYVRVAREHEVEPPAVYDAAIEHARTIRKRLRHSDHDVAPCHNDLRPGTVLRDGTRILLAGWRYAAMTDRFYDLGDLAAAAELSDDEEAVLLEAYFGEPPSRRRSGALKMERFLADFLEAAWGLLETGMPPAEFDFAGYAREHFGRVEAMIENPAFGDWGDAAAKRR